MRNLVMSVLVIGLLSLLPLSPRVAPSSGLLPVSISVGQDEANAYVTYRRARVTYRRAYRRGYRRAAAGVEAALPTHNALHYHGRDAGEHGLCLRGGKYVDDRVRRLRLLLSLGVATAEDIPELPRP